MDVLALLRKDITATLLVETPWHIFWIRVDLIPTAATLLAPFWIDTNITTINPTLQRSDVARLIAAGIVGERKTQS